MRRQARFITGRCATSRLNRAICRKASTPPAAGCDFAQNDFGNAAYDGPQPPRGHGLHHYHFKVVALDAEQIDISSVDDVDEFWRAVQPHVIAQAETIGTYQR